MKGASFCKVYTIFIVVTLLFTGVSSWAGEGATIIFDNEICPFSVMVWGDDYGSGLTVAMALKWDYVSDGDCTLDDGVEIILPEQAMNFHFAPAPDSFKLKGSNVPVTVYDATEGDVFDAYDADPPDTAFLAAHKIAYGLVEGRWTGKAFKAISYSALGTVELNNGEEAMLIAVGNEIYKNGWLELPDVISVVELH